MSADIAAVTAAALAGPEGGGVSGRETPWGFVRSRGETSMEWLNEPASWDRSGDDWRIDAEGGTDFWRVTKHGYTQDDGHACVERVAGDFTATARLDGDYATQYDQEGLLVREDAETWLKCGVEYVDGAPNASAVVTREYSDWSVRGFEDDPDSVWVRVERAGAAVDVSVSRDGDDYDLLRQAYLSDADELLVGPMAAAPRGDGFESRVEAFRIESESSTPP